MGDRRAGEDAADEPDTGRRTRRLEPVRLVIVHQLDGQQITGARLRRITERQRECRQRTAIVLQELDPSAHVGRIQRQTGGELVLTQAVVAVAARIG